MFLNFDVSFGNPESSLLFTDSSASEQPTWNTSGGSGSVGISDDAWALLSSDFGRFSRSVGSIVGSNTMNFDSMNSLVYVSDENTFQLSLESIREGCFCFYNDQLNSYGFSNSAENATTWARNTKHIMYGTLSAVKGGTSLFDWDLNPEPLMEEFGFTLRPDSPFFKNFHHEIREYTKRKLLNDFLHLGFYFHRMQFTLETLKHEHMEHSARCLLPSVLVTTLVRHYDRGTEFLFEYQKHFPEAFEGYRRLLVLFYQQN